MDIVNIILMCLAVAGTTFSVAAYVFRPDWRGIATDVKSIADLLHKTREEYVTATECEMHRRTLKECTRTGFNPQDK